MRDRLPEPGKEGRVKLTDALIDPDGAIYGKLEFDDNAAQDGSIYNKANVLPDEVCDTLGIDREAGELKDALATLASYRCVVGTYTGDGATTDREINLGFKPELVILYANPNDKYYSYTTFLMLLNDNKAGYAGYLWQSDNGFTIGPSGSSTNIAWNRDGSTYSFAAWR